MKIAIENVEDMVLWAKSRIDRIRRMQEKYPHAEMVEDMAEKRALEAVLRALNVLNP